MERLQGRARQLLSSAVAPNSMIVYNNAIRSFEKFRHEYNLTSDWPIPVDHMILYLSFCFEKGLSPKSITTYLAGINYVHKILGFKSFNQVFMVNKLLEGCRRSRPTQDLRAPLTIHVLEEICLNLHSVCYDNYETTLFRALFTLAYFGLFRVSELTASSICHLGHAILLNDVHFEENEQYIVICLRHYKTSQYGNPAIIKLPRNMNGLCPVSEILEYLKIRSKGFSILFCHKNGAPILRSQFSRVLSLAIDKTRYRAGHFRTHSFRIGRATDLAIAGYPSDAIMKLGRWSSNSFKLYVR